jgi:hypothetical protein
VGPVRGFTIVELVVSLTIFALLAGVLSLALARAYSAEAQMRQENAAKTVLTDLLDKLATVPYASLVSGTGFQVPSPCPGAGSGIGGLSCVKVNGVDAEVEYGFAQDNGDHGCTNKDPDVPSAVQGFVTVNACLRGDGVNDEQDEGGEAETYASRQFNAPRIGYRPGAATIRVKLTGEYALLPERLVSVVKAGSYPVEQVGSASVDASGVGVLTVEPEDCTTASPCALALSVGQTPTMVVGSGGHTVLLTDTAAAGPDAGFTAAAGAVTEVSARVARAGTAAFTVQVAKDGKDWPNTEAGSVCLWATFPDGPKTRTVPVCNTADPSQVVLDTYDPAWAATPFVPGGQAPAAGSGLRYPVPVDTPVRLTVDHPDGTCRYAPGMVGAYPVDNATETSWVPRAVCTSFTWGLPSTFTDPGGERGFPARGVTFEISAGQRLEGAVTWDNVLLAPGAVGYGADVPWGKPRTAAGCSTDGSCLSVLVNPLAAAAANAGPDCLQERSCVEAAHAVTPEVTECPDGYCYAAVNSAPYVAVPATASHRVADGSAQTFHIYIRDSDPQDAATLTATRVAASLPSGVTFDLGERNTVPGDPKMVRYTVTFEDRTGDDSAKTVTLRLTSGSGPREMTVNVPFTVYYRVTAWKVTGSPVRAAQGDPSVPVSVRVTDTEGNPYPDADVDFTVRTAGGDLLAGATIAGATTDTDGWATGYLSLRADTRSGTDHRITVTVAGSPATATLPLTVVGVTNALQLTLSPASPGTVDQGGQARATIASVDAAGDPVAGIVARVVVSDTAGKSPEHVYPASTGCVTTDEGTCSVRIVVEDRAPTGEYLVHATSGSMAAPSQTLQVAPVVASVAPLTPLNVIQGEISEGNVLQVRDGAGDGVPGVEVRLSTDTAGVTLTPTTLPTGDGRGSTDEQGRLTFTVDLAPNVPVGAKTIRATVAGKTYPLTLLVSPDYSGMTAEPIALAQGDTKVLKVTVLDGRGDPAVNARVTLAHDNSPVGAEPDVVNTGSFQYAAVAVTGSTGEALFEITADQTVMAGEYRFTATVGAFSRDVPVSVTAVIASVTTQDPIIQGGQDQHIRFTVRDHAGTPVPGLAVTVLDHPDTMTILGGPWTTGTGEEAGEFTAIINDANTPGGTVRLSMQVAGERLGVPVTITAQVGSAVLTPDPARLPAGSTATLTLTLTDLSGAPIPGQEITVDEDYLPDGLSVTISGPTNSSGSANLTLRAAPETTGQTLPLIVQVRDTQLVVNVIVTSRYSQRLLDAGATLLLPFDEEPADDNPDRTAYDLLGRHHGRYGEKVSSGSRMGVDAPVPGSQHVYLFDDPPGTAYIEVPDDAADILPTTAGSFTLAGWVAPEAGFDHWFLLTKGDPTQGPGVRVGATPSGSTLNVEVTAETGTGLRRSANLTLVVPAHLRPQTWEGWGHVALVVDRGSSTEPAVRLYVNGQYADSAPLRDPQGQVLSGPVSNTAPLVLGYAADLTFRGFLDEFAVFDQALSSAQVAAIAEPTAD